MDTITLLAPAKINLSLDITGKLENGYHTLDMIMQSIDLCDTVTISKTQTGEIAITCDEPTVPCDNRNIAYKCADVFFKSLNIENDGILIHIEKAIPSQAGLAGGSTDGAAVLVGLNMLYDLGLSTDELCKLGVKCGADIPFCIVGGTKRAEGIGEKLSAVPDFKGCYLALAKPDCGVSTVEAYTKFDEANIDTSVETEMLIETIKKSRISDLSKYMRNLLEDVCAPQQSIDIKATMLKHGAYCAMMTGSGSAVFGVFDTKDKAIECINGIDTEFKMVCQPINHGIFIKSE